MWPSRVPRVNFKMATKKKQKSKAPPKPNVLKVRVSDDQKEALQSAANRTGLDLSSWIRMVALKAAEENE